MKNLRFFSACVLCESLLEECSFNLKMKCYRETFLYVKMFNRFVCSFPKDRISSMLRF